MASSFRKGTLWPSVVARTAAALEAGALEPIDTEAVVVEDGGLRFLVRVAKALARKAAADATRPGSSNPFLPPDPALTVCPVPPAHLAVLNRFNVVPQHLLLVTRAFEEQDELLEPGDFEALWTCLGEVDGLGFYNGGAAAGASQRHKHLQLVPLPVGAGPGRTALDAAVARRQLPFPGALAPFEADPAAAHARYLALLEQVQRRRPGAPYNLLVTREWMLVVPRTREAAWGISMNALGFAGSLFVRDEAGLETVQRLGPLALLRSVCT